MIRVVDSIAIVPARGGSKRIPRKNVRVFHGQPLIVHTLRTLLASNLFERIIVSTDDDEIASIARECGVSVPFRRPASLADDFATTAQVVVHALDAIGKKGESEFQSVCVVYPAAVLVSVDDLTEGKRLLVEGGFDFLFAGARYSSPIQRAWRRTATGAFVMCDEQYRTVRTQDLEPMFHDAGQFYWSVPDAWHCIERGGVVRTGMIELEPGAYCDIDVEWDWARAELLYSIRKEKHAGE